jgi:hypothetical protein
MSQHVCHAPLVPAERSVHEGRQFSVDTAWRCSTVSVGWNLEPLFKQQLRGRGVHDKQIEDIEKRL